MCWAWFESVIQAADGSFFDHATRSEGSMKRYNIALVQIDDGEDSRRQRCDLDLTHARDFILFQIL